MVEQATFRHGGVTYPVPSSGTSSLLDADPALYYLLDYSKSVLQTYMGARLLAEATKVGIQAQIASAVGYSLPYDPRTVRLGQAIGKWPLLCMWRESQKYRWRTVCRMETISLLRVAYLLPPLSSAQRERIQPLLNSVPKILLARIENKFDPAYQSGANVLALGGIDEVDMQDDGWGSYEIQGQNDDVLAFPAWFGSITLIERDENLPAAAGGGKFTGVDIEIDDASSGAPILMVSDQANMPKPAMLAIAGLRELYVGDAVTTDTSGLLVTSWLEQSGSNRNATPPAGPNEPFSLSETPPGGREIDFLRFDGISTYVTATDATLGADTGKTLLVAFRLQDAAARASLVLVTDGTTAHTVSIEANTVSTAGGKLGLYAGGSSFDTQIPADTEWHIAILRITNSTNGGSIASTVTLEIDDLPAVLTLKSGTGNWQSLATATTLSVGALSSDVSHTCAHADIGVVAAFTARLSDADKATAIAYAKAWLGGYAG